MSGPSKPPLLAGKGIFRIDGRAKTHRRPSRKPHTVTVGLYDLSIPGEAWDLDWPLTCQLYVDHQDLLLVPAQDGVRLISHRHRYRTSNLRQRAGDLLRRGEFSYQRETFQGVPLVRVLGCVAVDLHNAIDPLSELTRQMKRKTP